MSTRFQEGVTGLKDRGRTPAPFLARRPGGGHRGSCEQRRDTVTCRVQKDPSAIVGKGPGVPGVDAGSPVGKLPQGSTGGLRRSGAAGGLCW